jgi:hypothetical protein
MKSTRGGIPAGHGATVPVDVYLTLALVGVPSGVTSVAVSCTRIFLRTSLGPRVTLARYGWWTGVDSGPQLVDMQADQLYVTL